MSKKNEISVIEANPILDPNLDLREVVTANLGEGGASKFDLDKVQIPAAGGTMWMIPTLQGPVAQQALTGTIIDVRIARQYWDKPLEDTGGEPPACKSDDGKEGVGMPGGVCSKCQFSQWGSDPKGGDGQACKLKQCLLIVPEGNVLPIGLDLPPSSIKEWRKFALRLINAKRPFYSATTKITLKVVDKPVKHAVAQFEIVRLFEDAEIQAVKGYTAAILKSLNAEKR